MKSKAGSIAAIVVVTYLMVAAQQVNIRYDQSYDFSKIKTFSLKITPAWSNPTIEAYVTDAVARELTSKGWTRAPNESAADALVVIEGTVEDKKIEESYYDGGIMAPAGVSGPAGVSNSRIIEERLGKGTITIFDAKTDKPIFHGVAVGQVSHEERKNEEKIRKAIEKVFKDFPPKARHTASE